MYFREATSDSKFGRVLNFGASLIVVPIAIDCFVLNFKKFLFIFLFDVNILDIMRRKGFFSGLGIKKTVIRLDLGYYWLFAALRIVLTLLPQTGYIHPDEYFQTVEVFNGKYR